jgi:predicted RNA-binding protein YlxR (DUF448 family)
VPTVRTRPARAPQRTCVACRESGEKRGLTRLVRSADGSVRYDPTGRLPGRGAYVCSQPACWERALGKGDGLARALRASITATDRATLLTHAPAASPSTEADGEEREHA